jgi:hypothetical protein
VTDFTLNFPFTKVDKTKRTVTGIATANNLDTDGDIMELQGSIEAFRNWPGNIREMHKPEAVGKMLDFRAPVPVEWQGQVYDGLEVTVYVSKGAENTWQKVLDGTLRGFSIGGGVLEKSVEYDRSSEVVARRVSKYMLTELSLVDNPANPAALVTMFKREKDAAGEDELVYKAQDDPVKLSRVFYCATDQIATVDVSSCSRCEAEMVDIGFVEEFDASVVKKMIDDYELKKNGGVLKLQEKTQDDTVSNMDELTEAQQETLVKKFVKSMFGKAAEIEQPAVQVPNITVNINSDLLKSAESGESISTEVEDDIVKNASDDTEVNAEVEDDSVEKSAKEDDVADETNSDDDIVKALSGVLNDALASFKEEITKTVDEKIEAVSKSVEETTEKVEKFADSGAVSKSADTVVDDDSDDELEKSAKVDSFWGGRFVPLPVVQALGYNS